MRDACGGQRRVVAAVDDRVAKMGAERIQVGPYGSAYLLVSLDPAALREVVDLQQDARIAACRAAQQRAGERDVLAHVMVVDPPDRVRAADRGKAPVLRVRGVVDAVVQERVDRGPHHGVGARVHRGRLQRATQRLHAVGASGDETDRAQQPRPVRDDGPQPVADDAGDPARQQVVVDDREVDHAGASGSQAGEPWRCGAAVFRSCCPPSAPFRSPLLPRRPVAGAPHRRTAPTARGRGTRCPHCWTPGCSGTP